MIAIDFTVSVFVCVCLSVVSLLSVCVYSSIDLVLFHVLNSEVCLIFYSI